MNKSKRQHLIEPESTEWGYLTTIHNETHYLHDVSQCASKNVAFISVKESFGDFLAGAIYKYPTDLSEAEFKAKHKSSDIKISYVLTREDAMVAARDTTLMLLSEASTTTTAKPTVVNHIKNASIINDIMLVAGSLVIGVLMTLLLTSTAQADSYLDSNRYNYEVEQHNAEMIREQNRQFKRDQDAQVQQMFDERYEHQQQEQNKWLNWPPSK